MVYHLDKCGVPWMVCVEGNKMAYVRTVKFSYYTVCIVNEEQGLDPVRFDFESWIRKAVDEKIEKTEIEFDGLTARLEELEGDTENKIWKLRFIKLRDTNIPSIVKKQEEAKPIELEDDEYIGEDLLMIYDSFNQVAMIQCNRFAMSKGKLEKCINKIWNKQEERIVLIHISKRIKESELRKKNFRSLVVRFANIHAIEDNHRPFSKIVNSYYDIGGKAGTITFSLGRGRQGKCGLNQVQVPIMLDDIYANMDIVTDAVLKVRDDDDNSSVDIVDLFDNSLNEYIDFKLEKREALEFSYAANLMVKKYLARKQEISQLLA